ncbi:UNVERIFIED_CONTAM: hypothetical protein K2H54_056157 [Gekko kuhli]
MLAYPYISEVVSDTFAEEAYAMILPRRTALKASQVVLRGVPHVEFSSKYSSISCCNDSAIDGINKRVLSNFHV